MGQSMALRENRSNSYRQTQLTYVGPDVGYVRYQAFIRRFRVELPR